MLLAGHGFGLEIQLPFTIMKKINFEDLILFENEDYLLINKPPFVSTLDDRSSGGKQSILELAREYIATAQVGHRLDRETSGVLAIAKNPAAYRHLSLQFQYRTVKKTYHAIVDGIHKFEEVTVEKPLKAYTTGIVRIDYQEGKEATTIFNTLTAFYKHTLVACQPITGRTHQIRVHLAYLKAPITGDEQYGGKPLMLSELKKKFNLKKDTDEQPLMPRFALHANTLAFQLLDEKVVEIEAPYPKDFKAAIKQLEKTTY